MARYKDVEGYRKLFDEEYKKTRKLISEGETHLDNLAEGFSEASRVIDRMPTADVVPKSEVERLQAEIERLKKDNEYILMQHRFQRRPSGDCWNDVIEKGKAEVAREIFEEIEAAAYYFKELKGIPAMAVSFREYVSKLNNKYAGEQK